MAGSLPAMSAERPHPAPPLPGAEPRPHALRALAVLGVLVGVALLLRGDPDARVFHPINGLSRATGALPWAFLSMLGESTVLLGLAAVLVLRRPALLWPTTLGSLFLLIGLHPIKAWLAWPRPAAVYDGDALIVIGKRIEACGFPSGHTAVALLAVGVVWLAFRERWIRALAMALGCGCALSRIVVGAHWLSDVLAGAGLGWACAVWGFALAERWRPARGGRAALVVPPLLATASVVSSLRRGGEDPVSLLRDAIGIVSLALVVTLLVRRRRLAAGSGEVAHEGP